MIMVRLGSHAEPIEICQIHHGECIVGVRRLLHIFETSRRILRDAQAVHVKDAQIDIRLHAAQALAYLKPTGGGLERSCLISNPGGPEGSVLVYMRGIGRLAWSRCVGSPFWNRQEVVS